MQVRPQLNQVYVQSLRIAQQIVNMSQEEQKMDGMDLRLHNEQVVLNREKGRVLQQGVQTNMLVAPAQGLTATLKQTPQPSMQQQAGARMNGMQHKTTV